MLNRMLGVRITQELDDKLGALAETRRITKSALVVEILEHGIGEVPQTEPLDVRVAKLEQQVNELRGMMGKRTPAKKPSFEIGDRIRIIKPPKGKASRIVGQKGVIAAIDGGNYSICLANGSNCEATAGCIELVK